MSFSIPRASLMNQRSEQPQRLQLPQQSPVASSRLMPQPSYANQVQSRATSISSVKSVSSGSGQSSTRGIHHRVSSRSSSPPNVSLPPQDENETGPCAQATMTNFRSPGSHSRKINPYPAPQNANSSRDIFAKLAAGSDSGLSSSHASVVASEAAPCSSSWDSPKMPTFGWTSANRISPDMLLDVEPQVVHKELLKILHTIEEQQGVQRETLSKLTHQWESRFRTLEKAVHKSMQMASATSTLMDERSARFQKLGEVLETAVDRAVSCSRDVSSLAQKVTKVENDLEVLARQITEERCTRATEIAEMSERLPTRINMQSLSSKFQANSNKELLAIRRGAPDNQMNESNLRGVPDQVSSPGHQDEVLARQVAQTESSESQPRKPQSDLAERLRTISSELRDELSLRKLPEDDIAGMFTNASCPLTGSATNPGQAKVRSVIRPASVVDTIPEDGAKQW